VDARRMRRSRLNRSGIKWPDGRGVRVMPTGRDLRRGSPKADAELASESDEN
jgi:hypothetical protein